MRWYARAAGAALLTCCLPAPRAAAQTRFAEPAAWQADLAFLSTELPRLHPDLFHRVAPAQWDSAVRALSARLGNLSDRQAYVAFQRLVALVGDGHTALNPLFERAFPLRYYPVELALFDDGLFVKSAAPEYRDLVGGRVVRLGRVPAEAALAAAATTISADNEWWARTWAPGRLVLPEIVDGLGLADDAERLPLVVERAGREIGAVLRPAGPLPVAAHGPGGGVDRSGWIDMRGAGAAPPWLRRPEGLYFEEYLAETRTLYVAYRAVIDGPDESNAAFWARVFAAVDSLHPERLVLDLRENVGGNSFNNLRVIRGIVARPAIDQPGRLFAIIGSRTFSAAMNLTNELERYTRVTFVGEPTGSSVQFFGDHVALRLPRTGLVVNVSSLWWQTLNPRDDRRFIAPARYTPLAAADYQANRDPALDAIVAGPPSPGMDDIEAAALAGDTARAGAALAAARAARVNRYRNLEAEVNALGYRLLRSQRMEPALAVFRLNAQAFPQSANVFDSLGEAYATAGRRDEAIAAFRAALERDPAFDSSRAWLERLGAR
jgi:hypothetical protein